jgi:hypothetical protein
MATSTFTSCTSTTNGTSGFRIKRPLITTNGFVSDVDLIVKGLLDELNQLLGKRIFNIKSSSLRSALKRRKSGAAIAAPQVTPDVIQLLNSPLTPKFVPDQVSGRNSQSWEDGSLALAFFDAPAADGNSSLADYIDVTADLAALKYAFQNNLNNDWQTLDYNTKTVLDGYPAIVDYLIAYAFHIMNIQDVCGLRNFIYSNRGGARNIVNYVVLSGARTIINNEQLNVPDYNQDDSPLLPQLSAANLSLALASFKTSAQAVINDYIFNAAQSQLIDQATIGPVPAALKPLLVQLIKQSRVPITKDNVDYFLPLFISQISGPPTIDATTTGATDTSDQDFDVTPPEDDTSSIQISKSAVKCASQLYYCMVMSDELNVLGAVEYFTHKYLLRNGMEIQDSVLRDDLQTYVFSSRFTDLRTNRVVDRTKPAERQMFYRQVFNYGNTQVPEDLILNAEFPKLWKVLMLESARYIERAQASPNPDGYVSRQNVMQAVEDLQYNLSTNCTGMAIVVAPLIYAELDFAIRRILMSKEVLAQLVPNSSPTWWKAIEVLTMGMSNTRPKATVLYNKAKLGNAIIRAIADYNPSSFQDDKNFSDFISDVDAYITTQSILQEALTDDLKADQEDPSTATRLQLAAPPASGPPVAAPAKAGEEWDF